MSVIKGGVAILSILNRHQVLRPSSTSFPFPGRERFLAANSPDCTMMLTSQAIIVLNALGLPSRLNDIPVLCTNTSIKAAPKYIGPKCTSPNGLVQRAMTIICIPQLVPAFSQYTGNMMPSPSSRYMYRTYKNIVRDVL